MLNITFLPKRKTTVKPVTYHVNETNNIIAVVKAKQVFMLEHPFHYYDKVAITEMRIIK